MIDREAEEFRRKVSIIFPILKELNKEDLQQLRREIIHDKCVELDTTIEGRSIPGQKGVYSNEKGWVYMIKEGIFQVRSESDRIVTNLSSSDLFGLTQLINNDVKVSAFPFAKTKFYRLKLEFFEYLISKYPYLRKMAYASAAYNYLKCCPYKLAKQKSKYFRRLRRISYFHINKLFKKGTIKVFTETNDILHYMHQLDLTTLGIFILKGEVHLKHQNLYLARTKMLFNLKKELSVKKFFEDQGLAQKDPSCDPNESFNKLNKDLYSVRNLKANESLVGDGSCEEKILAGNAIEIHGEYLDEAKIVSSELVVFIVESSSAGFGQDNKHTLLDRNQIKISKINRKNYM